ncbi:Oidioi.mRNA.OKI2018_I69.chr2.g7720.t1.cds [Oikopleura dioica]|uniref:vitamin-K-epoxide reductase (warfarin-sensitive) n=1 Tax=Oikopleura dioica TaxID=34765 RepID=A0ABN7TDL4_OIKDI|nr:Oidioi.mRNA.OKI2018_I69.chr2.g7720.t1.cds [Oikopleura dioica]
MLTKIILSLAGIGLMYYEKVVDENMTAAESARKEYKASCDMKVDLLFTEQEFSCSTILKSDYAVGFGFLQNVNIYEFSANVLPVDSPFIQPNYVYGLWHYILQLFVAILGDASLSRTLSVGGIGASVYFTYAMIKLEAMCLACIICHFINVAFFVLDTAKPAAPEKLKRH